jgi:hypothetical protein
MSTATEQQAVELTAPGEVRTTCRKCGERIPVMFGDLDADAARLQIQKIDRTPMECPGFHVELCGWISMWRLDEAFKLIYGEDL